MAGKHRTTSEKKVNVSARLDPKLLAELQEFADADERTISYMLEKAAKMLVEALRGQRPKR